MFYSKKAKNTSRIFNKKYKKKLLKNFNYKQNIRFFLYLKRTKLFVYISIIEN